MADETIKCPKCGEVWPVLSEQRIAIEQFNACLKCSFFDHSAEEHVKLIEKIEEEMGLDFKAHLHALQHPGKAGVTIAVAKDRANPYAESQLVVPTPHAVSAPKWSDVRRKTAMERAATRSSGYGTQQRRDRARVQRQKMKKHKRRGR